MTSMSVGDVERVMDKAELKFDPVQFRAIQITFDFEPIIREIGWMKTIWGYDIFLNKVPLLKSLVLANVIMWLIMFLVR